MPDFYRIYRGQDGIFDYENPVAEMALNDEQVEIPNQVLPPDTIWHYIRRRVADCCDKESPDSPVCIVKIDSAGDMYLAVPNVPLDLTIELLADGKAMLRWRYTTISEEISPTGFNIYMDSGNGFDFETPIATIAYGFGGSGEFNWTSGELNDGQQYRFCVRSYSDDGGEIINTNSVSAIMDSTGPDAIADLSASWEEF